MAKCDYCEQEMVGSETCIWNYMASKKTGEHKRDSSYFDDGEHCHDCGILNRQGNFHHPGCDIERCPICGYQLISCECWPGETSISNYERKKEVYKDNGQENSGSPKSGG